MGDGVGGGGDDRDRELLKYYAKVLAKVRGMLKGDSLAEDIVQRAYQKALEAMNNGATPQQLGAWFTRIATNEVVDHYRKQKTRGRRRADVEPDDVPAPSKDPGPWAHISKKDLEAGLATLPTAQRTALMMKAQDKKLREIAEALGVSIATAHRECQRARQAMIDCLREDDEDTP